MVPFLPTSVPPPLRHCNRLGSSLSLSPQETPDKPQDLVWVLAPFPHHLDTFQCPLPSWVLFLSQLAPSTSPLPQLPQTSAYRARPGSSLSLSPQETPDELLRLIWGLAPFLHHVDTYRCPFPSREPRQMLSICLGSFSVSTWSFHLSVAATIPRRARYVLIWVPSLSLSRQAWYVFFLL